MLILFTCLVSLSTQTISGFTASEMSQLPTRLQGGNGLHPFQPSLKFTPHSIFRAKGGQKTINVFSHFHGLSLTQIINVWSMLGAHSQLRRGQMSHICDISPLRVKRKISPNENSEKQRNFLATKKKTIKSYTSSYLPFKQRNANKFSQTLIQSVVVIIALKRMMSIISTVKLCNGYSVIVVPFGCTFHALNLS